MFGLQLKIAVKAKYEDTRESAYVSISRYGTNVSLAHISTSLSLFVLTPEILTQALQKSLGRRISLALSGSFVGEKMTSAGIDTREQAPACYPLIRAEVLVEVKASSLRFSLAYEGSELNSPTIQVEFELPDDQLSAAIPWGESEKLASEILEAKQLVLARQSRLIT